MKIDDNPSELIYVVIKYKNTFDIEKLKFFWYEEKEEINLSYKEIEKDEEITTRIYYFKSHPYIKKLTISPGEKIYTIKNNQHFLFDLKLFNYEIISLSEYDLFKIYQKLFENDDFIQIKQFFYKQICLYIQSKKIINFNIFLDVLNYYKNNEEMKKNLYTKIASSTFNKIDINEILNSKDKYIDIINNGKLYDINEVNQNEKGELILMLYLYILYDHQKYNKYKTDFIKNNSEKSNKIQNIISQNETIEYLYLNQIIKQEKLENKIKICNYFSNYLNLLSNKLDNLENNFQFSQKEFLILNEDNVIEIKKNYKKIVSKFESFTINHQIWLNYIKEFKKSNYIEQLINLKNIIPESKELDIAINACFTNIIKELKYCNNDIYYYIQNYLVKNIDILQGKMTFSLKDCLNLKNIDDNFILEFKNLKLKRLFNF